MTLPKISVVVPTFNEEKYLPVTIDWIMHQDYPDIEIIIVDGGSTDGTKQFLGELENRVAIEKASFLERLDIDKNGNEKLVRKEIFCYPQSGRKIKMVIFDCDIGPIRTFNEGFQRITGEFCTYIVGDDIPHINLLSRLARTLNDTGADFAYADMAVVNDAGRILYILRKPDYDFYECFCKWYHLGVAHLYRSIWHKKAGILSTASGINSGDYDLYLRFAMAGCKFIHVPEVLYSVRIHTPERQVGSHSPKVVDKMYIESIDCAKRARQWHVKNMQNSNIAEKR